MPSQQRFEKTPLGVEEVGRAQRAISNRARRVLILIDGRRTLDDLQMVTRPGELPQIISELLQAGLIVPNQADAEEFARTQPLSIIDRLTATQPMQPLRAPQSSTAAAVQAVQTAPAKATAPAPAPKPAPQARNFEAIRDDAASFLRREFGDAAEMAAHLIESCKDALELRVVLRTSEHILADVIGAARARDVLRQIGQRLMS